MSSGFTAFRYSSISPVVRERKVTVLETVRRVRRAAFSLDYRDSRNDFVRLSHEFLEHSVGIVEILWLSKDL